MPRFDFVFILLVVVLTMNSAILQVSSAPKCGPNEVYTTCGPACPPSCYDVHPICTLECVAGCQCKPGFLRNAAGGCGRVCPED
ncbi:chymotrypsin inhibitor-like isoform X2 [Megalopta genalis]|uniref:chymotrypsin inhibitor-like isoform X1 n=1 Tax=Megalopta genalis TaxID=115081 RepID=UPI003FD4B814